MTEHRSRRSRLVAVTAIALAAGLCRTDAWAQVQTRQTLDSYQSRSGDTSNPSANTPGESTDTSTGSGGSVQLRSNTSSGGSLRWGQSDSGRAATTGQAASADGSSGFTPPPKPYRPGEFELFVNKIADTIPVIGPDGRLTLDDTSVRRFGAELVTSPTAADTVDFMPQVPPDYLITPGDEVALTIWGSIDADLRLVVDRAGRLNIPRVGSVLVAGVRYEDLPELLRRRVGQVFRNFQLSVSLGQLRSIRVYVTGFVSQPGSYVVNSLSTVFNAVMKAGGPSASGTFRSIELRRRGTLLATLDLYDLLLKGDRSNDRVLQPEDVVHIGPVSTQAALIGSVNKPSIFELRNGETIADIVRMAGGLTPVADRSRLAIERLGDRIGERMVQLALPDALSQAPANGDVLRAFSAVDAMLPQDKQNKKVRVEGEVALPGDYILPASSSIEDAIRAAGGLTPDAFVFGTEFSRESVRQQQQVNYDRALRDLETEFAKVTTTQRALTAEEAQVQAAQSSAATRLIQQLRQVRPTGRIVLQLDPHAPQLPNLAIESGDRLYIPAQPTTVGVFGSVFNGGTYLFSGERPVDSYIDMAGGSTRGADNGSAFVVRANGSVVSARQYRGFFDGNLKRVAALPGDTVFVPEELGKTTFTQLAKEWTQILYQFGLGAAAIKVLRE